jgi:hypothetical protein
MNIVLFVILVLIPHIMGAKAGSPVLPAPIELQVSKEKAELEDQQDIANRIARQLYKAVSDAWMNHDKWTEQEAVTAKKRRDQLATQLGQYMSLVNSEWVIEFQKMIANYQKSLAKTAAAKSIQQAAKK